MVLTSPVGPFPVGHCVVGADDGCGFLLMSWVSDIVHSNH